MTERTAQFHALYGDLRINAQLEFYNDRRKEYAKGASQAAATRNGLLYLASVVGVVAQFFDGTTRAAVSVGAGVLAAFAGAVTAYGALIGFEQLEKLYGDASRGLDEAAVEWGRAATDEEFDRVEQVFRTENGQWGQLVLESAAQAEADQAGSG